MRIIQLNSNLVCKLVPCSVSLFEPPDDIKKRSRTPEVLLFQAQLFSTIQVIIWVKHGRYGLRALLVSHGTFIITRVEFLKIKLATCSLARPEPKVIRSERRITRNGNIMGDCLNDFPTFPGVDGLAILILIFFDPSVELDIYYDLVARKLPRVEIQPVIGNLDLIPIDNLLLEDAIPVPQSVSPRRVVQRS